MSDTNTPGPIVPDLGTKLIQDHDDHNFTFAHTQHISQGFLDRLRDTRENSLNQGEGEYMSVASVPVAVVEQWQREGFDIMTEPAHAIVARLKQQNLDAFLTTKKQV